MGAIADYTEFIKINHGNAEAYYLRGCVKLNLGKKKSGCDDLKKAGELGYLETYVVIKKYSQESVCSNAF